MLLTTTDKHSSSSCIVSTQQLWCLKHASHLQACLGVQKGVLMTGTTGVGKSVIISGALEKLRGAGGVVPYNVNFSAQTKAVDAQVRQHCYLTAASHAKRVPLFHHHHHH